MIDLHCDILSKIWNNDYELLNNCFHFDTSRAKTVGIMLQFFALFTDLIDDQGWNSIQQQIYLLLENITKHDNLSLVKSYADITYNEKNERINCLLHLEDGAILDENFDRFDFLYEEGLRSIGLTWNYRNFLADGVGVGYDDQGITKSGIRFLRKLRDKKIVLDLAHLGEKGYYQIFDLFDRPVVISHANAYSLCQNRRNIKDEQLKILADNKGIIGITSVSDFVKNDPAGKKADINDWVEHFVYIAYLIGPEYLAIGSDFDGAENIVMNGVEDYKYLDDLFTQKGFSKSEIRMIKRENALRVLSSNL